MSHPALNAGLDHDACGVGFVAQLGGEATGDVIERALVALGRLSHRGGVDSDGLSGDGAGLLLPIPRVFFRSQSLQLDVSLPEKLGLGSVFLPPGRETEARRAIESLAQQTGLRCLGWRDVPINFTILGSLAASTMPLILQCFFESLDPAADIERQLFFLRKRVETEGTAGTYFCSLSSRTVVYKGLLTPTQFRDFYLDLTSSDFRAPFAIFHQRYSTNTQPSWAMAQPFRYVAHNGEMNTISATRRWMRARERKVQRELETGEWFHALEDRVSDSASFDNALEILGHRGYHIPAAILRMVPPASESKRSEAWLNDFLREESFDQEPWDGPAALVFTDGNTVGAKLDRNGLRPMRYCVTADGLVIAGSEAGLTDLQNKEVIERQRLGPGEMLVVDPAAARCFIQADFSQFLPACENGRSRKPVRLQPTRATQKNSVKSSVPEPKRVASALGWSDDQYRLLFESLGAHAKEASWSMGDDAPPAFLSSMRRPLWDYCKQRFAQVTNPPIDPLREGHVMSLDVHLAKGLVVPETDITGITLPITKHNYLVTRPEDVAPSIREAFLVAASGRPGPVLVDITKDAQNNSCSFDWDAAAPRLRRPISEPSIANRSLGEALDLIREARREVILAGHGVILSGSERELLTFAEAVNTPVALTLLGIGAFPASHPLCLGMMGMHGEAWVNKAIQESDLLLAFGMRFDDRVTGTLKTYAQNAKKIHVDIDPAEINKNVPVDLPIVGDLREVLRQLLPELKRTVHAEWLARIEDSKQDSSMRDIQSLPDDGHLYAAHVINELWGEPYGDAIVVTDVGQHQMWEAQYYRHEKPRTLITSGGLGTMGFALPAAIGAKFARPEAEVWVVVGDGGIQMTMAELATIVQEKINIKIAIINNGFLGMVRQWQEFFFEGRDFSTPLLSPHFLEVAAPFGIAGVAVNKRAQIGPALQTARSHAGPVLIDFQVEQEDSVFPMVPAGAALDARIRRPNPLVERATTAC